MAKSKSAKSDKRSEAANLDALFEGSKSARMRPLSCDEINKAVSNYVGRQCSTKANSLPHHGEDTHSGCGCTGRDPDAPFLADLIVLIDSSGSMSRAASAVSSAVDRAIEAAKASCPVDLRIAYFGVEGVWSGTVFTTSHLDYLTGLGVDPSTLATNNPTGGYAREEGANAVEDLSNHYDWRDDACRAIFYISDEELDGISPLGDVANEAAAVAGAVAAATTNNVTVFANHLTTLNRGATVEQNYRDMCEPTGGKAYISAAPSVSEYESMLAEAICGSCGVPSCTTIEKPAIEPCISVTWGDSDCDCMETDDTEIVCVTISNCYADVTLRNFNIGAVYIREVGGGAVPMLPDGSPSVEIVPLGPVCFGDVGPCVDDVPGQVSRQFMIRTRGAKAGDYELRMLGVCYDVCFHYQENEAFTLTLCKD